MSSGFHIFQNLTFLGFYIFQIDQIKSSKLIIEYDLGTRISSTTCLGSQGISYM